MVKIQSFSGWLARVKGKRKTQRVYNGKGCANCGSEYVALLPNGLCEYCAKEM